MQFDVYANPITRARRTFPYVAVLQHDLAETGYDRVAAFLAPRSALPRVAGRIAPVVDFDGRSFVLLVHLLTNLPVADLKTAIGNVSAHRDRIVEALDWLFLGV